MLAISGTASLAGTLNVDLFDPGSGLFAPSLGDSFDILMADTLSGSFNSLLFAAPDGGLSWDIGYLTDAIGSTDVVRRVRCPQSRYQAQCGCLALALSA